MMAWIESHQELGAHPKTQKFARLLGINRPTAVGHLQFLWWWAMDYAQDGCLARFDSLDIAIGGEWDGEPVAFVDALERSGFLDRDGDALSIHDWSHYAGRLIERRRQDAERKRTSRGVQRTSNGRDSDIRETAHVTVPNLTVPNLTVPKRENETAAEPPDPPPPKVNSRSKPRTPVPKDFSLTEKHYEAGSELGLSRAEIDLEHKKFLAHYKANGKPMADWQAAWSNWLLKIPDFKPGRRREEPTMGLDARQYKDGGYLKVPGR